MQAANDPVPQAKQALDLAKKFMDVDGSEASGQLAVMQVTAEGMVMKSQSTGNPIGATVPLLLAGSGGIAASMLLPALARAKAKANAIKSANNAKNQSVAMIISAEDNDGNLPDSNKWCDSIIKEVGTLKVFASPQDPFAMSQVDEGIKVSSYAFK